MSRTVMCSRYKEELPGLETAPFPGAKGQVVFETVSAKAWTEWQGHQTMLINEKHLNMMDKSSRKYLNDQRDKFIVGEAIDDAEGYVPEEK